ncbi:MAG: nitroreductase family protein [Micrococcales bacterium]|nr:nitroreductase family protein [Micrococcales bacterium]
MTNAVLDAIAQRYSCRSYTDEPVAKADLDALALAAVQAPSANGAAPWYLAIITNHDLIQEINAAALQGLKKRDAAAHERALARGGDLFYNGRALIVVAIKQAEGSIPKALDAGILVQNVTLAAHSLGLGTLINGLSAMAFSSEYFPEADRLVNAVAIPEGYAMSIAIVVGHPDKTRAPHTPDLTPVHFFA